MPRVSDDNLRKDYFRTTKIKACRRFTTEKERSKWKNDYITGNKKINRMIRKKSAGFSAQGKRAKNEDYILPDPGGISPEHSLFIVCDGVGGAARGEVASKIAAESFAEFISRKWDGNIAEKIYQDALEYAEGKMDQYISQHPGARGMGTTLALVHFGSSGAAMVWCGDSRIYHIRNQTILFVSEDHSHANLLVKAGIITREEIPDHPDKNIIIRAIQGASVKKTKVDVVEQSDIRPGDYFFLCSDGIWEAVSDKTLVETCSGNGSVESKMKDLHRLCTEYSHDNFSGFLIEIDQMGKGDSGKETRPGNTEDIPFARMIT